MEYRTTKEVLSLVFSILFSPHYFLSLSLGARRGMGKLWLVMRDDVRVRKGNHLISWPRGVIAEMVRQWALAKSLLIGPSTV
jgi:hypothetical protein